MTTDRKPSTGEQLISVADCRKIFQQEVAGYVAECRDTWNQLDRESLDFHSELIGWYSRAVERHCLGLRVEREGTYCPSIADKLDADLLTRRDADSSPGP